MENDQQKQTWCVAIGERILTPRLCGRRHRHSFGRLALGRPGASGRSPGTAANPAFHRGLIASCHLSGAAILWRSSGITDSFEAGCSVFLSHGHAGAQRGIVLAKFAGTALVARIFTLTRPQLLRIAWFAWSYERLTVFKTRIYSLIKSTALYQLVHEQHLRLRGVVKSWFGNRPGFLYKRWLATRRIARRRKQAWGK